VRGEKLKVPGEALRQLRAASTRMSHHAQKQNAFGFDLHHLLRFTNIPLPMVLLEGEGGGGGEGEGGG
jgi:hypothetical protein